MILVVGATGALGGMITKHLLSEGRPTRILVREGSDYQPLQEAGAEAVIGDLKDPPSLQAAMQGVDVVITTANSAARGGGDNVETVEIEGNRNLIEAAREAGVSQFIFTSALGATEDSPSPFLRGKALAERHLRESGVPFTILSPNIFMEVWIPMIVGFPLQSGNPVTLVGEGMRRHTFVSSADVAAFAVAAIDNPAALNQQIVIGGPVAVSWRDILASTSRVIGSEIPVRNVTPGDAIPGLPQVVADLAAAYDAFDTPIDMSETASRFGVTLTSADDFILDVFGGGGGRS